MFLRLVLSAKYRQPDVCGPQAACLSLARTVNSTYGRTGDASNAESFSAAGPRPATPAKFAHSAGAITRAAKSRSTRNGNESGPGRIGGSPQSGRATRIGGAAGGG